MQPDSHPSRRQFLAHGAAALTVLATPVALLAAPVQRRELAPITEKSYIVDWSEGDTGQTMRSLESEMPVQDADALTLLLEEDPYTGEGRAPGSVFVNISHARPGSAGDSSFGAFFEPQELDTFIANLSALRDRARAVGILAGSV
jgi:hypothetical protein